MDLSVNLFELIMTFYSDLVWLILAEEGEKLILPNNRNGTFTVYLSCYTYTY